MGHQIIKADKRVNLYLDWSSVVDAPVFVGDREQMLDHLTHDYRPGTDRFEYEVTQVNKRLDRADEYGTSEYQPFGYVWGDPGLVYKQYGFLKRTDFLTAALLWKYLSEEGAEAVILKLLEPFEDDEDEDRDDTD